MATIDAETPVIVWDNRPGSRPEEGSDGCDQHGNFWLYLGGKPEMALTAAQIAESEEADRRANTLTDPDVCREAVRRFKAARPLGVDATTAVLADYGLMFERDLAEWQKKHMRNGVRDMR